MLYLDHKNFLQDSLFIFNYHYAPLKKYIPEDAERTVNSIIEKLSYYDSLTVEYVLKELIKQMELEKYNVINHYEEFKPMDLVKLLCLLGLDIKQYYN